MFEAVVIPALLAAQVDEEVRGPGRVLGAHVPHDAERVTGHFAELNVAGGREGIHVWMFGFCRQKEESQSR